MNELQSALNNIVNNGTWKDAILYAIVAFVGFTVVSALFRSWFFILLGFVAGFYVFSIQSPSSQFNADAIAPDRLITMMAERSQCAASSIGKIENLGQVIMNGDVVQIAKQCGLMP